MDKCLLSSGKDDWETPIDFFNQLDSEFHFTLDPCCTPDTAKCKKYYTIAEDGLNQSWRDEVVFINPPYSKGRLKFGGAKNAAPFPSMVVIFHDKRKGMEKWNLK